MSESTLSLKKSDFESEVGIFLGYGPGEDGGGSAWSSTQSARIASHVKSGLRRFYYPPPLGPGEPSHDWSFLRPTASFALASGLRSITLPDDFAGIDGRITVLQTSGTQCPIDIVGIGVVNRAYGRQPDATGPPEMAEVSARRGTGPNRGQRFDLLVYPETDAVYTLQFAYSLAANALTGDRPYAYGGPQHHETIKAACIAMAELEQDGVQGERFAYFMERLATSISLDRKNRPVRLGYNGDLSDGMMAARQRRLGTVTATFGGVEYD